MSKTILVVEDDKDLREFLQTLLSEQRYKTYTVGTGSRGLKLFEKINPDLVVLDLVLPDVDGETLCMEMKKMSPRSAVLILTAKDSAQDVVRNLNHGADDYISKPFSSEELVARIRARLRDNINGASVLKVGDLSLDTETFEVIHKDKKVELTQTEFELLRYLLDNKNRVLSRDMILSRVWSTTPDVETRVVDVYIGYLRKKIDKPFGTNYIQSVRGFGYVIRDAR